MTTNNLPPGSPEPAATNAAETHWDGFYRESSRRWSGRPNPVLVDLATLLTPGRALDVGCGEGGDALWLAKRGLTVTAVDVSATVLERTAALAMEAGVGDRVTVERHDLDRTFPDGEFDLVSAQYLHSPVGLARTEILRRAAGARGGTLLIVGHAAPPPWAPDHAADISFPTPAEALSDLALPSGEWRVERAEVLSRAATGPAGSTGTVEDSVVAVVRASAATRPD